MRVAVVGGSGFIGRALLNQFTEVGIEPILFSRQPERYKADPRFTGVQMVRWPPDKASLTELGPIDGVINLAGETINQRWTVAAKKRIMESRLRVTRQLIRLIENEILRPAVLINASAIGYYGTSYNSIMTEGSPVGDDFLAEVTSRWEEEADQAQHFGVPVIKIRLGVVLGREEGALPRMVLPYRFYAGGRIASGRQPVSWIHIEDVTRAMLFLLQQNEVDGPVNLTAPHPVTMNQFGQTVAQVLKRPHWLPVPAVMLRLLLGEMSILVVEGQHVLPEKLLQAGFTFHYPHLDQALRHILHT